jgi:hypothetical protein
VKIRILNEIFFGRTFKYSLFENQLQENALEIIGGSFYPKNRIIFREV